MHINEIWIGVLVSSLEKNGTTKILIMTNAGKPKHKAIKAEPVKFTAIKSNAPLKKRKEMKIVLMIA